MGQGLATPLGGIDLGTESPAGAPIQTLASFGAAAEVPEAPPMPAVAGARRVLLRQQAEANISGRLLTLAREIRRPLNYIGYSAFVLFALLRRCRPVLWEGESRIDLIAVFATWAQDMCQRECLVQGAHNSSDDT